MKGKKKTALGGFLERGEIFCQAGFEAGGFVFRNNIGLRGFVYFLVDGYERVFRACRVFREDEFFKLFDRGFIRLGSKDVFGAFAQRLTIGFFS